MKETKVVQFYVLCNRLKDVVRTGWLRWSVKRERIESVAEHIYGTQMLAIAMKSEYQYDVDIMKVIYMLAIHELGEAIIGDIIHFDITKEEKEKIEHRAVHEILNGLIDSDEIEKLFLEFEARETPEAIYAYQCDKLECGIQCKLYDEQNCVELSNQRGNTIMNNPSVMQLLSAGLTWSSMWLIYDQERCSFDENFSAISNYVMTHMISQ